VPKIIATAEAINSGEIYSTQMIVNKHEFISDELHEYGGKDSGPSPSDYLCAALASCKAITLRMYANRKNWPVEKIKVKVNLVKDDLLTGNNTFFCEVKVTGNVDIAQQKRLLEISKACPVQRLLTKQSEVISTLL
jgi:putative redox protein